jgi:hypothetical protein
MYLSNVLLVGVWGYSADAEGVARFRWKFTASVQKVEERRL